MNQVKQMMAVGISASTSIKELLGISLTAWADKHSLSRPIVSEVLNGERGPRLDVCTALSKDLGGSSYDWAMLLWEAARPAKESFAA